MMSPMSGLVTERLDSERRRQFVGRQGERETFQTAITASVLPFQVLYVFGPGGIGKTTLLDEFAFICREMQTPAIRVDGRNIEPAPAAFTETLRNAMGFDSSCPLPTALASQPHRQVIFIDTYETLAPLDRWMREVFLIQLPQNALVVLASRNPPASEWRVDPGWQTFFRPFPLRNLTPAESRAFLSRRGVPSDQFESILDFSHGHPLALSLVADLYAQRPGFRFQPEAAPDIIRTLLEKFVQKVPGPAHRAALEACVLVALTTESLLSHILGISDAHELFEWLRGLSFIESRPRGLFPHDLAREALVADLRWRNPDWFKELHRRARDYYANRLRHSYGVEQQSYLFDLVFLHRNNPAVRPYFEWQEHGRLMSEPARPEDLPLLTAMVNKHEGPDSAQIASYWFNKANQQTVVFREQGQPPSGFMLLLSAESFDAEDLRVDPIALAAWTHLKDHAPLRPGEVSVLYRYWMAGDTYQNVSPVQSLSAVTAARHYLSTPGLAFSFLVCSDASFWTPVFEYTELHRLPNTDITIGGKTYAMFGHDWRVMPPLAWLSLLGEKETSTESSAVVQPVGAPRVLVLSEPEFAAAVRAALRDWSNPELLRHNPLTQSRMVVERLTAGTAESERGIALQMLVKEAAESLQGTRRENKFYRALLFTYFRPAPTQEAAAEDLDLPYSTYRRHLKAGIDRISQILWQKEIGR